MSGPMNGRLYLHPEPTVGAHPGYRGTLWLFPEGVRVLNDDDSEILLVDEKSGEDWPMGEWLPVETNTMIPWHRVHSIEWAPDEATP